MAGASRNRVRGGGIALFLLWWGLGAAGPAGAVSVSPSDPLVATDVEFQGWAQRELNRGQHARHDTATPWRNRVRGSFDDLARGTGEMVRVFPSPLGRVAAVVTYSRADEGSPAPRLTARVEFVTAAGQTLHAYRVEPFAAFLVPDDAGFLVGHGESLECWLRCGPEGGAVAFYDFAGALKARRSLSDRSGRAVGLLTAVGNQVVLALPGRLCGFDGATGIPRFERRVGHASRSPRLIPLPGQAGFVAVVSDRAGATDVLLCDASGGTLATRKMEGGVLDAVTIRADGGQLLVAETRGGHLDAQLLAIVDLRRLRTAREIGGLPQAPASESDRPAPSPAGSAGPTEVLAHGHLVPPVASLGVPVVTATFGERHGHFHSGLDFPRQGVTDVVAAADQHLVDAIDVTTMTASYSSFIGDEGFITGPWQVDILGGIGTLYLLDVYDVRRVTPGKPVVHYVVDHGGEAPAGSGISNGRVFLAPGGPDSLVAGDQVLLDYGFYPGRLMQANFSADADGEHFHYVHVDHIHDYIAWNSYPATATNRFHGSAAPLPAGRSVHAVPAQSAFAAIEQVVNFGTEQFHVHFTTLDSLDDAGATNSFLLHRFTNNDPQNRLPEVRALDFLVKDRSTPLPTTGVVYGPVDLHADCRDDMGALEANQDDDLNPIREVGTMNAGYWITPRDAVGGAVGSPLAPEWRFPGAGISQDIPSDPISTMRREMPGHTIDPNTNYWLWLTHAARDTTRFWNTRAMVGGTRPDGSDRPEARAIDEALFRDGRYEVGAVASDALHTGPALKQDVIVDNFRPFLQIAQVHSGTNQIYYAAWARQDSTYFLTPADPRDGTLDASGHKRCADGSAPLVISLLFSEAMDTTTTELLIEPLGLTVPLVATGVFPLQSFLATIAPSSLPTGGAAAGYQTMIISGRDLAGNELRGMVDATPFSVAEVSRAADGTLRGTPGPDAIHGFGICQAVGLLLDTSCSMGPDLQNAKDAMINLIDRLELEPDIYPRYVLYSFNEVTQFQRVTTDPDAARADLDNLPFQECGPCPEAWPRASIEASNFMTRGGTIVLATNGDGQGGPTKIAEAERTLKVRGVEVFSILSGTCDYYLPPANGPASARPLEGATAPLNHDSEGGSRCVASLPSDAAARTDAREGTFHLAAGTGGFAAFAESGTWVDATSLIAGRLGEQSLAHRADSTRAVRTVSWPVPLDASISAASFTVMADSLTTYTATVRRPNGTTVTSGEPGVSILGSGPLTVIRVQDPAPGTWTTEVTGPGPLQLRVAGATPHGADIRLAMAGASEVLNEPTLGLPSQVQLRVRGPQAPVGLELIDEAGSVVHPLTLFDDGAHGDRDADDSIYGGLVTILQPGLYRGRVTFAEGAQPIVRESRSAWLVASPHMTVCQDTLDFGTVPVGALALRSVMLRNYDNTMYARPFAPMGRLAVTGISAAPSPFSAVTTPFTLDAISGRPVEVSFTPPTAGSYAGTLTLQGNAPDDPVLTVVLRGVAVAPPVASVSVDSVGVTQVLGTNGSRVVTLRNTGASTLQYRLVEARGDLDNVPAGAGNGFGYTVLTSQFAGGPPITWREIATTGADVPLGDDEVAGPFPIGFTFPYYGQVFTEYWISSNGFIVLGGAPPTAAPLGTCSLPSPLGPPNMVAVFWADLDAGAGRVVRGAFAGSHVVEFENVALKATGDPQTFQVVLHPEGTITLSYRTVTETFGYAGTQNGDRSIGQNFTCFGTTTGSARTLELNRETPWLSASSTSGTLAPGASRNITLNLNTRVRNMEAPATYDARVIIDTNDPLHLRLPVRTRLVTTPAANMISGLVTLASDGTPIPDAVVTCTGNVIGTFSDTTDAAGAWSIPTLPNDTYSCVASHPSYLTSTAQSTAVPPNQIVNFQLGRPVLAVAPDSLDFTLAPGDSTCIPIVVSNPGTQALAVQVGRDELVPPGFSTVGVDPAGDATLCDLTQIEVDHRPFETEFRLTFDTAVEPFDTEGILSLDLDRNVATGAFPPGQGLGATGQDVGAELELYFLPWLPGVEMYDAAGHFLGTLPLLSTTTTLGVVVPAAFLAYDDGTMNVSAGFANFGAVTRRDYAPSSGHFGITGDCPWLSVTPSSAGVAPGGTQTLTVCLNTTGLAAGAVSGGSLLLRSNDPARPLVTVPISLRVGGQSGAPDPGSPRAFPFVLGQNEPNPVRQATRIAFSLPSRGRAVVRVFDVAGRLVATLLDAEVDAGPRQVAWDGRLSSGATAPSGFYLYRLEMGGKVATRKMLVLN